MKRFIQNNYWLVAIAIAFIGLIAMYQVVDGEPNCDTGSKYPLKAVEATAYNNPHNNKTYSGTATIEGRTIAGRVEDIGKAAVVYLRNPDGSLGKYLGIYEFQDTGWGENGEIPAGTRVDLYMEDYDRCISFGVQDIYLQIIPGVG